ncbi:LacI family DNA-binding transcriptional regulator [Microlunatus soli]|uniref:Transcriptional regulator, LacI family n=1 Tax=Microlunatus soli TaxID=630515 RepID=A0A1H1MS66_9ACTN|nr:LacI family DNA-binding transcriptional regulator [Microlunatus soli]SDR89546.1 transcriptional regulator, LacI family [Microlunatus soli]
MAGADGRQPTILTVAAHAGVSPMTVSRVLSGQKNVSPELSERVRASVAELGYRRNEQARSLRPGQRSGLIGVAITNIANPYYAELLLGADEVVGASGRGLLIGSTNEDEDRESTLISKFIGRQVEGLIVVPAGARRHLLPQALGGTPLVLASRAVEGARADTVLVDDIGASYEQTAALLAAGHRRIGYLGTATSVFTGLRRFDGFRMAHEDAGIELDQALVFAGQSDVQSAERVMLDLLGRRNPPTAVFCANNQNAIGAVRALRSSTARARTDPIHLLSFDNFELADVLGLPITIIDHDARELGRLAARMMLERLEGTATQPPRTVELPTRILSFVGRGRDIDASAGV